MLDQIRNDLSAVYPPDIVDALTDSFVDIREHFYLGKHEPSELNGGKFVEACIRLLQHELTGSHIPIGKPIRNMSAEIDKLAQTPATTGHDSYRLHIPKILGAIYDIRNRRGVGHLSGDVNPNLADSTFIVTASNWIVAELYRLHYSVSLEEAQGVVDNLVERKLSLIHDVGGMKRVLDPRLSAKDQTMALLYSAHPDSMSEDGLRASVEYANASNFRSKVLRPLHKSRLINYTGGACLILPPGQRYVEERYSRWTHNLNHAT